MTQIIKKLTAKIVGNNIRFLRQEFKWGQEAVASRLGISVPAVSKIETGATDINLSRLQQIADIFGVSVASLLAPNAEMLERNLHEPGTAAHRLREGQLEIESLQKKVIMLYDELQRKEQIVVG